MTARHPLTYASSIRGWRRIAIAAFVTALLAPAIAVGILYAASTFGFDIDDTLPREAAIVLVTVVAAGVPFAAAAIGALAAARLVSRPWWKLSIAAVVIGLVWGVATLVFLSLGFAA